MGIGQTADPDEMQHNAAFHQGLHCLLRLIKQPSGTEMHHNVESSTCGPLKYKWGNSHEYVLKIHQNVKGYSVKKEIKAQTKSKC